MKELIKIVIFSIVMMMGFTGYTRYGIPLIIPEPPPVEETLSGEITMDQYIAFGDKIFNGKGTCMLCHNPVGGRAPVLDTAGSIATERLKDARYKGAATNAEEFLRESLIDTSAYVVVGFGKKGTNDTVSPMPNVSKGAIGLSEVEMNAVIAYLQSLAGVDVTVPLPSGDAAATAEEEPAEIKVAENAAEAFEKFECGTCHMHPLIEEGGDIGPDLTPMKEAAAKRVKGMSAERYLAESITDPNAFLAGEYDEDMMPADYPERMTVAELNMIVDAMLGIETKKEE